MALKLAEGLDEAGYCRLEAPDVAEAMGIDLATVERVWARLRQIEPAGLFCPHAWRNAWAPSSPSAIASIRR